MNSPQPPGEPVRDDGLPAPAPAAGGPHDHAPTLVDGDPAGSPGDAGAVVAGRPGPLGAPRPPSPSPSRDGQEVDRVSPASIGRLAATVERLRQEVQAAHAAADGRALIELAKGILVERLQCGPAEAARQLGALAEQAGVPLLELATDVINRTALDRFSEAASDFVSLAGTSDGTGRRPADGGDAPHEAGPTDGAQAGPPSVAARMRTAESGALAADDTQAAAESLLEHALAPLGATAVAVWAAGHDASFTLAGHAGFPAEEARRWRYVPPGVATVAREALRERRTVWFDSLEGGLPSIGSREGRAGGGRVAVPAGTGGRIVGVLEICWPHPLAPQPPQIERQVEALAELCAHTLETHSEYVASASDASTALRRDVTELVDLVDSLYDPALVLVPHLDPTGRLTDFRVRHVNRHFIDPAGRPRSAVDGALLLEVYPMAAGESELFETIERTYATGEPFRTERMTLTALVDQVPLEAVADISVSRHGGAVLLIWRTENEAARLASLLQHAQRLGRVGGFEENILTGEIIWNQQMHHLHGLPLTAAPIPLEQLPAHAHPDDGVAIVRFLRTLLRHQRPASTAFRLQRPDGVTRHVRVIAEPVLDTQAGLLAVRGAYQDISAQHWTEVALAATRDQLAHTEQESAERSRLALQLQHAIMPPARGPLDAPGLRIGVRYRPAETEQLVGGDWYDTFVLPSKQILVCVGDVAGHGIEAATSMIVLRNALRGLAVTGAGPAQLLTWLNIVAHHLTDQVTATAVCGLFDPSSRVLRWARAGHLPPVLVRGRRTTTLPVIGGILLGAVAQAEYQEGEVQLEPGDTLLMYTDGLIERKGASIQESLELLIGTAKASTSSLEQRLDRLLTHSKADTDDDTCVVGLEVE
ncbi:SpoIIE family protein phosphatase [Streptomyces sp. SP18CS02]|uniref:SpoIIE family protein phosphatase n=1 Tax=Streptomyces sp. SP18CS02 TaxID=3002531 RepID=UPI002E77B4A7|nr:SpoIIE family protein phosphatase [Streptomyces sp. SP18CS02]MEE1752092.1 SpoIIE family protein phosphatase [Streptomyces sp. SP18CS02]